MPHNLQYDSEDAQNVTFKCVKSGCTQTIGFNKPWVGSPAPVWQGDPGVADPDKATQWATPENPDQWMTPCEGTE